MSRIYTESAACFDRRGFALLVDAMKSHGPWPPHYHAYEELVFIESGSAEHLVDRDERYPLVAGDVFVIKPRSYHGYANPQGFDVVTLRFDVGRLGLPIGALRAIPGYCALFDLEPRYRSLHAFNSRLHLSMSELRYALELAGRLGREIGGREPGYEVIARSMFICLVGFLCRCYGRTTSPKSKNLLRVERAIRHIEANQDGEISIPQLCDLTGQSVNSLLRDFKYATGESPIQYVLSLRVKKAADLIVQNPATGITQTAFACGFNDGNYFSRQFRRRFKMSPTQFRRQVRSKSAERGTRNAERGTGKSGKWQVASGG